MMKFMINNMTNARKTEDVKLLNKGWCFTSRNAFDRGNIENRRDELHGTRLLESEGEVVEPTNHNARFQSS